MLSILRNANRRIPRMSSKSSLSPCCCPLPRSEAAGRRGGPDDQAFPGTGGDHEPATDCTAGQDRRPRVRRSPRPVHRRDPPPAAPPHRRPSRKFCDLAKVMRKLVRPPGSGSPNWAARLWGRIGGAVPSLEIGFLSDTSPGVVSRGVQDGGPDSRSGSHCSGSSVELDEFRTADEWRNHWTDRRAVEGAQTPVPRTFRCQTTN